MKVRRIAAGLLLLFCFLCMKAQENEIVHYGEDEGLAHKHVTQIVQDRFGFLWFATWNGLNRFDGRDFISFKVQPGEGVGMSSDRVRTVAIDDNNPNLLNVRVETSWYHFNLLTGKFETMKTPDSIRVARKAGHGNAHSVAGSNPKRFELVDRQGLRWSTSPDGINLAIPRANNVTLLPWAKEAEVKAIYRDMTGNVWVASSEDRRVRLFDSNFRLKGYLSPSGSIVSQPVGFSWPVYCVYQSDAHTIWMGSKPGGLFKLTPRAGGYNIEHVKQLADENIYDIVSDGRGRLWLATMGRGVLCYDGRGHVYNYVSGPDNRARRVYLLPGNVLVATTTDGLLIIDINPARPYKTFWAKREANRPKSMSSSACMSMLNFSGHCFIATESGGIDELLNGSLLSDSLEFRHFTTRNGLASDVVLSLSRFGHNILAVSNNKIIILNPLTGESYALLSRFFGRKLDFSEAKPLQLSNGKWVFGLTSGGLALFDSHSFKPDEYKPPIQLTSLRIENQPTRYILNGLKEIVMQPGERTLTLTFAALDYRSPRAINYAYRLGDSEEWNYLGNSNTVSLPKLRPGHYVLQLRATNANGTWSPDVKRVAIRVMPLFSETLWFKLLMGLLAAAFLALVIWTRSYIRKIKKSQKDTLAAYLALMEKVPEGGKTGRQHKASEPSPSLKKLSPQDKAFMDRLLKFVEEHISDSEVSNELMAQAAAVSKSGLNRKLKSIVGLTPADFLREGRIKRACRLLQDPSKSVAEVAFSCGFTDAKYFSKVFRNSVGVSPTQYRTNHIAEQ